MPLCGLFVLAVVGGLGVLLCFCVVSLLLFAVS